MLFILLFDLVLCFDPHPHPIIRSLLDFARYLRSLYGISSKSILIMASET